MTIDLEGIKERAEKFIEDRLSKWALGYIRWNDVSLMAEFAESEALLALSQAETRIEKLRTFTSHLNYCTVDGAYNACTCGLTALLSPSKEGKE